MNCVIGITIVVKVNEAVSVLNGNVAEFTEALEELFNVAFADVAAQVADVNSLSRWHLFSDFFLEMMPMRNQPAKMAVDNVYLLDLEAKGQNLLGKIAENANWNFEVSGSTAASRSWREIQNN